MEIGMVIPLAVLAVIAGLGLSFVARMRKSKDLKGWLDKHGLALDYNYNDVLGIDKKAGKLYVYTDAARILGEGDVRSIEKTSIHETKYNSWGFGFHKDKECKLIIHTTSVDQPIQVVGFDDKNDLDLWYSRISAFYKLS